MDPVTMMMMMAAMGAIGGGVAGLVNDPNKAAMGYAEQLPGTVTPYYQPYIDTGLNAMGTLEEQFMQLINNPQAIQQMLASGFETSPGYEFSMQQGMNASNNAASAGGMLGSPAHTYNSQQTAQGIADQDFENYMNQMMGLYGTGISGMQGLNQIGYQASNSLASLLGQNLMNMAGLAGQSAQGQNSAIGSVVGGVTGALGF
jgi:hypothetical protein